MKTIYIYLILIFAGVISFDVKAQTIMYVNADATGTNNGSSWANAYTDLQSAINAAAAIATTASPVQVWVKADTYFPTTSTTQTLFFEIKNNVEMYGGFSGTETSVSQRDFRRNETILSGNIGSKSDSTDNSDKILVASSNISNSALVDGFTFTGAHINNAGGAVAMNGTAAMLTINNCTFHGNYASLGSAITSYYVSNAQSALNVYNSTFYHNGAIGAGSSAIYSSNVLNVVNCVFYDNTSFIGGAITGYRGSVSVTNSTFSGNTVGGGGGAALAVQAVTLLSLKNSIFWNNTGGSYFTAYSSGSTTFSISNNLTTTDPLFVDYENRDLRISQCSPAVGIGSNAAIVLTEDFDGNPRTFGTNVDAGAFEVQYDGLSFSAIEIQDISCNGGNDGIISANGGGGTGSVSYSLDGVNFSASPIFENLAAGDFTLTLLDNGDGCSITTEITLSEPDALGVSSLTSTDVTCNGDEDGKIDVTVSGGGAPFRVSFDGGSSFVSPQFTGSYEITDLDAGTYQVTIVDGNGCNYTYPTGVSILEPDVISASPIITHVNCHGEATGSFTANASGGTAPLYYTIEGLSSNYLTSPTFENLEAGTYTLHVIDSKMCYEEYLVEIEEPTELQLSVTGNSAATCEGQADGEIDLFAAGGTAPYVYSVNGIDFQGAATFNDLAAGNYTFVVEDANGCQASVSATIDNQLEVMVDLNSAVNPTCPGGSDGGFEASASGGVSPYSYSIDGVNFQSGDSFSDLSAGNYTVTVMDSEGCFGTTTVTLTDPQSIDITATISDVSCFEGEDGIIDISTSGGAAPYEYSLDGTTFQTSPQFTGLSAGMYTVTVVDDNGCLLTETVSVPEPDVLDFSATTQPALCHGDNSGNISITATGGTSPYAYSLDGTNFSSSSDFSNLASGTYTVILLDASGCTHSGQFDISEPDELTLSAAFDGSHINLTAQGGTSPYMYSVDGTNFQSEASFLLGNGEYTFTVKDANDCEAVTNQGIVITAVELAESSGMKIYPNPAVNALTLYSVSNIEQIRVLDFSGRLIVSKLIDAENFQLDVSGLKQGVYLLKLIDKQGGSQFHRFVKGN